MNQIKYMLVRIFSIELLIKLIIILLLIFNIVFTYKTFIKPINKFNYQINEVFKHLDVISTRLGIIEDRLETLIIDTERLDNQTKLNTIQIQKYNQTFESINKNIKQIRNSLWYINKKLKKK